MSREIPLTRGKVAIVDDEDYEYLMQWKWAAGNSRKRKDYRAVRSYRLNSMEYKIYMARLIMHAKKGVQVDHLNRDGLDNRKENLRICTNSENCSNKDIQSNNTSGFKGVTFIKSENKWRSKIQHKGILYHLGCFDTPLEAALEYDKHAILLHGKFASTNHMLGLI